MDNSLTKNNVLKHHSYILALRQGISGEFGNFGLQGPTGKSGERRPAAIALAVRHKIRVQQVWNRK